MTNRRKFIKNAALVGAGLAMAGPAYSYRRIIGANARVNVAVFGTNSRGAGLSSTFAKTRNCLVTHIGDTDTQAITKGQNSVEQAGQQKPAGDQDFRRILALNEVDAVVIATPDHWHAPMAIMSLNAGKHVYVEKPCSHNPAEGEMLIAVQRKHPNLKVQMGNQQRSSHSSNGIISEIHDGLIGRAYYAKSWYSNTRGSIGRGQAAAVPEWLDYDLWQGPAPRRPYKDNLIHYNWHWFWHWGTGEILNNATHEVDVCRWALQVDYPEKVSSNGGRYHFDDDWQAYDTQDVNWEYADGKMINWEGKSCNGVSIYNRGRGAMIYGTEGAVLIDRDGYIVYDKHNNILREGSEGGTSVSMDVRGGGTLDSNHSHNFIEAINGQAELHSPIEEANISVTTCHLGNIAHRSGGTLELDPTNGKPKSAAGQALWGRDYEPGWEPKV
ncbi:MAG: Gfo/Idh/MocA family oxidoreductase [Bacteroidota bacterium]